MAIYHFSAKVISRAAGSSAVAAAAYRSASRLHDQRLGRDHDFSNKAGVVHSEVLLPENAPEAWRDRERLWNDVEAAELRKDAQLAREIEFAIPREMQQADGIELARSFVRREFVDRGMVADLNVHRDTGADGLAKPHAHVMLGLRGVSDDGFGAKVSISSASIRSDASPIGRVASSQGTSPRASKIEMIGAVLARYSLIRVPSVLSLSSGRRLSSEPLQESQTFSRIGGLVRSF